MITSTDLSNYRKQLRELINTIDKLAYKSASSDPLIQGTPNEVYRTCGQKNCACATDKSARHGPYRVIQIYQGKKQRQISLRKEQKDQWQHAKKYQKQKQSLLLLKKTCNELTNIVQEMINKRLETLSK